MARAAPPLPGLRNRRGPGVRFGAHPLVNKFFADRCPHLAAMVAYYALLSLLPLLFLMLSLIGAIGRPAESSFLVQELEPIVPGQSVASLVDLARSLQENARELSVIGAVGLVWGALGFLSALESALNIVYGVPNRAFVRQKAFLFVLVGIGLAAVFASLIVATTAHALLDKSAPNVLELTAWRVGVALIASTLVTFGFLLVVYRFVPNTT